MLLVTGNVDCKTLALWKFWEHMQMMETMETILRFAVELRDRKFYRAVWSLKRPSYQGKIQMLSNGNANVVMPGRFRHFRPIIVKKALPQAQKLCVWFGATASSLYDWPKVPKSPIGQHSHFRLTTFEFDLGNLCVSTIKLRDKTSCL
jgi:hypothetical protein